MQDVELEPERARRCLEIFRLRLGHRIGRVKQQGDRARRRHKLVHQLEPLLPGIDVERDHAGEITARPIEARDESGFNRVDAAVKDDGNRPGRSLRRHRCGISSDRRDHGHVTANEIGGQLWQPLVLVFRPAIFDGDVTALDEPYFGETAPERRQLCRISLRRCCSQHPDYRHRLLGARRARPRRRGGAK